MEPINYSVGLADCIVLGGAGLGAVEGETVQLEFTNRAISVSGADQTKIELALAEVADVVVSGPGTVSTGGGFVGGGFGVAGALEGIGMATILNAISTRTKIHTFIGLITNVGELHVHYSGLEPGALRMALAPVFASLRTIDPNWIAGREAVLHRLLETKAIDEPEFGRLQSRLQAGQALGAGPRMGRCPACNERLPVTTSKCPKCQANFAKGAAWSVIPSA